jgi:hypothetical protein
MVEPRKYTIEDKLLDAQEAFHAARKYHLELLDIYRYFMPWRLPVVERSPDTQGAQPEGAQRATYLYDSTGPSAAFAFVANMKADWMPGFDDFFKLQNGPLYVGDDSAERQEQLELVTKAAHGLLAKVRLTSDEMFADLFAGTGAMFLSRGDRRGPIRGVAVPTTEMALEVGPWGDVDRWYWKRKYKARQIEQMWPNGKFSDQLARRFRDNRNGDLTVTQYTYWNPADEIFHHCVWCDGDLKNEFHTELMDVTPWVTPRFLVVPGESMGRGLAHLGLPGVKTLNKARELALRAAAFALLGLWVRRNDGVFNPNTAVMTPGAMWKVAYADGPMRSISRLDIPANFDVSSIIINDEREQLRRVLLDDELPELKDSVRSPTEIAGRMRRYDRNRGGATTRLALELVTPMVQRTVDLMAKQGMLPRGLAVDQILTEAVVAAPAAAAQRTDKVERVVSWLQIMQGLLGPQFMALNAKVEEIMPQLARDLGIEERLIRKKTEADQLKALIDSAVQQAVAQEREAQKAAPAQPQAEPEAPGMAYMNGAM